MFSRNSKPADKAKTAEQAQGKTRVPSILSSDIVVTGDISSDGEVQIDGEVIGDIRGNVLLIGQSAKIKGEINANTIRIHGSVNGQIKAKVVHLAKTAHVIGDILHENLSIDEGAFIEGHITRMADTSGIGISDDRVNLVVNKNQSQQRLGQPESKPLAPGQKPVAAT